MILFVLPGLLLSIFGLYEKPSAPPQESEEHAMKPEYYWYGYGLATFILLRMIFSVHYANYRRKNTEEESSYQWIIYTFLDFLYFALFTTLVYFAKFFGALGICTEKEDMICWGTSEKAKLYLNYLIAFVPYLATAGYKILKYFLLKQRLPFRDRKHNYFYNDKSSLSHSQRLSNISERQNTVFEQ